MMRSAEARTAQKEALMQTTAPQKPIQEEKADSAADRADREDRLSDRRRRKLLCKRKESPDDISHARSGYQPDRKKVSEIIDFRDLFSA